MPLITERIRWRGENLSGLRSRSGKIGERDCQHGGVPVGSARVRHADERTHRYANDALRVIPVAFEGPENAEVREPPRTTPAEDEREGTMWPGTQRGERHHPNVRIVLQIVKRCSRRGDKRVQVSRAIRDFIDGWYSQERQHSSLGFRSPVEYERQMLRAG